MKELKSAIHLKITGVGKGVALGARAPKIEMPPITKIS